MIQHSVPEMSMMQPVQGAFLLSLMLNADPLPEGAYPGPRYTRQRQKQKKADKADFQFFATVRNPLRSEISQLILLRFVRTNSAQKILYLWAFCG